ncbi:MAG TPA: ankyrin repeat domain-containing protein [Candidatus Goldiibacteriota bacterium]|nr:ankyrin repeat domain-containing protein [Candidatus Goldiibacteriota bacterium]
MKKASFLNNEFASAFKDGYFELAHKLVKAGADMHNTIIEKDDGCFRVMEYAVENGLFEHINALINMGYGINDRDDNGRTAVFIAVKNEDYKVLTEVLKYKPDLNLRYKDMGGYYAAGRLFHKAENTTVLMQACYISGLRTIKKLLKRGVDANAQDSCGFTPLMYLCVRYFKMPVTTEPQDGYGEIKCILSSGPEDDRLLDEDRLVVIAKVLLKAGADKNMVNKYGKTAWGMAISGMLKTTLK